MDAHTPRNEDDVSDVERRLAGWRPGTEGLDADAMLFAAGIAAGRGGWGRMLALTLCGLLAIVALGLGAWGMSERAQRHALVSLLHERAPTTCAYRATHVAVLPPSAYEPSPEDYLSMRRRMDEDPAIWLASLEPAAPQALGPPPPG